MPLPSTPLSRSLFAGRCDDAVPEPEPEPEPAWTGEAGGARGIVEISRSWLRRGMGGCEDEVLRVEAEADGGIWSIWEESQLSPTGSGEGEDDGEGRWALAFSSHAARALWSTGQAAGGTSASVPMVEAAVISRRMRGLDTRWTGRELVKVDVGCCRVELGGSREQPSTAFADAGSERQTRPSRLLTDQYDNTTCYCCTMADNKVYRASTTAPVNIAVIK